MTIRRRTRKTITALLFAVSLCNCGYETAALVADVNTRARSDGTSEQVTAKGFSDPDASSFTFGLLLYVRWTVSREEVHTVELFLDLDRDALPNEALTGPVVLTAADGDVLATVRYRRISGRPKSEHTPSNVEVIVRSWRTEQLRQLSLGTFSLRMPDDDGIYTDITGSWETTP